MFKEDETQYCKNCFELQRKLDITKEFIEEIYSDDNQTNNIIIKAERILKDLKDGE